MNGRGKCVSMPLDIVLIELIEELVSKMQCRSNIHGATNVHEWTHQWINE